MESYSLDSQIPMCTYFYCMIVHGTLTIARIQYSKAKDKLHTHIPLNYIETAIRSLCFAYLWLPLMHPKIA